MTGVFEVNSVEETWALARQFAAELKPGDVVCLEGDLGAGKTTFTQGLAAALGVAGRVTSPTFCLVQEHRKVGKWESGKVGEGGEEVGKWKSGKVGECGEEVVKLESGKVEVCGEEVEKCESGKVEECGEEVGNWERGVDAGRGTLPPSHPPTLPPSHLPTFPPSHPPTLLVHMDLYRLRGEDDVLAIGWEDYLAEGAILVVEWPERAGSLIPPTAKHVVFTHLDGHERRRLEFA